MAWGAMGWELSSLAVALEALLFVAEAPVRVGQLAAALEASPAQVEEALQHLARVLKGRGLRLSVRGTASVW